MTYPEKLTPEQQKEVDRLLTPEKKAELERRRIWNENLTDDQRRVLRNSSKTVEWFAYAAFGAGLSAVAVLILNLFGFGVSWWIPGGTAILAAIIAAGGKTYEVTARKKVGLSRPD